MANIYTNPNSRQTIHRSQLDRLSTEATPNLNTSLQSLNKEVTPTLELRESNPVSLALTVGPSVVQNPNTLRSKSSPPIGSNQISFVSGTISLPPTSGSNIAVSPGSGVMLTISPSSFIKCLVQVNSSNNLVLKLGTQGVSLSAATLPSPDDNTIPSSYFVIRTNGGGAVQNVLGSDIYQYDGATPSTSLSLDGLTDVTVTAPSVGDVLVFTGSEWINSPISTDIVENTVINGALDFWKRGTSFLFDDPGLDSGYFADKFEFIKQGNSNYSAARSTDIPGVEVANYSALLTKQSSTPIDFMSNFSFDSDTSGWIGGPNSGNAGQPVPWTPTGLINGNGAAYDDAIDGAPWALHRVATGLTIGVSYTISAQYTTLPSGNVNSRPVSIRLADGAPVVLTSSGSNSNTLSTNFVATATSHDFTVHYDRNASANIEVDNFFVRETTPATDDFTYFQQLVEGNFAKRLYDRDVVLSFWVKSDKTGTYCLRVANGANNRFLIKEYTVLAVDIWERKTIRFNHDETGTWDRNIGTGMKLQWILQSFSPFNAGTADVWTTNPNDYSTSNQVNHGELNSNEFRITEVVLDLDNATLNRDPAFRWAGETILGELQLCQRYFASADELITLT